jgi:L-amino acid N-acyltransferase YncA
VIGISSSPIFGGSSPIISEVVAMKMNYPKSMVTGEGLSVGLPPIVDIDAQALRSFLASVRPREEWFLRKDPTDPVILDQWLENLDCGLELPIVAVREDNGEIIGALILSFAPEGFRRPLAHVIVTVHPAYRFLNVRTWLIEDCIELAMTCGTERLVVDFLADLEADLANVLRELDFREVQTLRRYVGDSRGKYRDLLVMAKNLPQDCCAFQSFRLKRIPDILKEDGLCRC